jgi:hypothetical protein
MPELYVNTCTGRRHLFANIAEDVPHFCIEDGEFFFEDGEVGVHQLDEVIEGLRKLRLAYIATLLPAAYQEAHLAVPVPWEELSDSTKLSVISIKQKAAFKVGNGRDTLVIIKHNFHTRHVVERTNSAAGLPVRPKVTRVDDDTMALEFTPEDRPGAGDEQYTVKVFAT